MARIVIFLITSLIFISIPAYAQSPDITKTGPIPPIVTQDNYTPINPVLIDGIPVYYWHRGCTPTALGMVLAYYDLQGYDILPNYHLSQSSVNQYIASEEHFFDYSLPIDWGYPIKTDMSELPTGDEHQNNSIADCLKTSQSRYGLLYGWTNTSYIGGCLYQYGQVYDPQIGFCNKIACYNFIKQSINGGVPVLLTVQSPQGTHSVVATGYDDNDHWRFNDSWGSVRWAGFSFCGYSDWCIYHGYTLRLNGEPWFKLYLPIIFFRQSRQTALK